MDILREVEGVSLVCDKPCCDEYLPRNLLSLHGKGFMAERFIKPPVVITVTFPCPIRLRKVVLENTIGSHFSSGVQVLAHSDVVAASQNTAPIFKLLGQCYNCPINSKVIFSDWRSRGSSESEGSLHTFNLSSRDSSALCYSRELALRIVKTSGGGIPVIASLTIIGEPRGPHKKIFTIVKNIVKKDQETSEYCGTLTNGNIQLAEPALDIRTEPEGDVPKEFIDPLTFHIMSNPVILASGYTVDQSTLDRHCEAEKSRCRNPVDPFTGVLLSNSCKPIFNTKLKERIDKFVVMRNFSVPRTTGTKRKIDVMESNDLSNKVALVENGQEKTTPAVAPCKNSSFSQECSLSDRLKRLVDRSSNYRTITLSTKDTAICVFCSHSLAIMYQLECQHLICRNCLLENSADKFTCMLCKQDTIKSNIRRIHHST